MTALVALLHVATLAAAAITSVALGGMAWRVRDKPGAIPFLGLMTVLTVWSGSYLIALTSFPGGRLLWERIQWLGIPFVSVFFLLFALDYLGYDAVPLWKLGLGLSVVPLATIGLVWTNQFHELIWTSEEVFVADGLVIVGHRYGPGYWVHFVYAYALILAGSFLLVRLAILSDYLYWDQSALLLIGVFVPLLGNALSVLGAVPIPGTDLTPYAFTVTGVTFGNALVRYRLFEIVPATWQIGQETVIGNFDEGVLITDDERAVVYCNDEALSMFDVDLETALGRPVQSLVDTEAVDFDTEDALGDVDVGDRSYEVRSSEIRDRHDRMLGYTFVFNDITGRKERERELQRQRDRLETLDQLNAVIRGVNQELLGANTREEVTRAATDRLADSSLYDAAWTVDESVLDDASLSAELPQTDGGVVEAPLDEGQRALEGSITADVIPDDWEPPTDDAGRWTTVPLVYRRTVYGALVLFSTRPDAFGQRELAVLDELGASTAHAINAVEKELLLVADTVVELALDTDDPAAVLAGVSASADCSLELAGVVPADDGELVVYVRSSGRPADAVRDAMADHEVVAEPSVVDGGDPGLVECRLAGGTLLFPLRECGARVESASAEAGRCTVVATVSPDADVRAVLERVQQDFPETDLRSKQRRDDPVERADAVSESHFERLTDRQQEVVRAAYDAGYFEWPRDTTGQELADSFDIASSTLQGHLRKAQNQLLGAVLTDDPALDDG